MKTHIFIIVLLMVHSVLLKAQYNHSVKDEEELILKWNSQTSQFMAETDMSQLQQSILQIGVLNSAEISTMHPAGNQNLETWQLGLNNSIRIFDLGYSNKADIHQIGVDNNAVVTIASHLNEFDINQLGDSNQIEAFVKGDNNSSYQIDQLNSNNDLILIDQNRNGIEGVSVKMSGDMKLILRNGF